MSGNQIPSTHRVTISRCTRDLPVRRMPSGTHVAIFNILGDTALTEVAGTNLAQRILGGVSAPDFLLVPDGKSLALAHVISRESGLPLIVARKGIKSYMLDPVVDISPATMTTGGRQTFAIDGADVERLRHHRVMLIDDVISTGATQDVLERLISAAGGTVAGIAVVFTEGDKRPDVISLGHLPVWPVT